MNIKKRLDRLEAIYNKLSKLEPDNWYKYQVNEIRKTYISELWDITHRLLKEEKEKESIEEKHNVK